MSYFIQPNREQLSFHPIIFDKLVPEDHPVRFFWKVCEELELEGLYNDYKITKESEGRPAYEPKVLLCLWIYAYSQGIRSSRELAELCKTRADFIWLCGEVTPEYKTLADFRSSRSKAIEEAFCKLVITLKKLGLIKAKVFFQDGTKIMADASFQSFKKRDELDKEWEKAKIAYQHFINYPEDDSDCAKSSETKREQKIRARLEVIKRAINQVNKISERRKRLDRKEREAYRPEDARASLTDPDAQFMPFDRSVKPGYNGQICVDGESEIIVAKEVSNEPTDNNRLLPMIKAVKNNLGVKEIKGPYVTDGGYYKDKNIIGAKALGVEDLILPIKTDSSCPETQVIRLRAEDIAGRELLKRRSSTIERIFGFIKEKRLKMRRFNLRGLVKVGCEWTLVCLAYNLIKYFQLTKVLV